MRSSLYLLALAVLPACAQRALTQQAPPPPPPTRQPPVSPKALQARADADTALVFQRTPCFGSCPTYTATVFRSGRVAYFGDRWVPVLGQHTASLPAPTVSEMLAEARRINFNSLKPQYLGNVSDLPGTIVTVYQPGQRAHRVEGVHDMPENLQAYILYLRSKFDPLAGLSVDK